MSNTAGELDARVFIEYRKEDKESDYGGVKVVQKVFANVWACIDEGPGREFWQAMQVTAQLTALIKIRYLPGVTPKMRVRKEDRAENRTRIFNIAGVQPIGRKVWMHLHCIEEVET